MKIFGWMLIVLGLIGLGLSAALQLGAVSGGSSSPAPLPAALVGLALCAAGYGVCRLSRR